VGVVEKVADSCIVMRLLIYSRIPLSMVKITTTKYFLYVEKKKEDCRFENNLGEGIGIEYGLSDRLTCQCCTVVAMIN
jgi:hypothetical protein